MAVVYQLTTMEQLRGCLMTMEDFLRQFSLEFSVLSNVPEELRSHSLIMPERLLVSNYGFYGFAGYIAEDRVDDSTTVIVGKEGQPFDTDELMAPDRRFVMKVDDDSLRFVEWRGKRI